MRPTPNERVDLYRKPHPRLGASPLGQNWGYFEVSQVSGTLRVLASDGTDPDEEGWEHVSVSLYNRCPTWEEMCFVKSLFWGDDETVMQFHPRKDQYVDTMPFCLHLWRRRGRNAPLPPRKLI